MWGTRQELKHLQRLWPINYCMCWCECVSMYVCVSEWVVEENRQIYKRLKISKSIGLCVTLNVRAKSQLDPQEK